MKKIVRWQHAIQFKTIGSGLALVLALALSGTPVLAQDTPPPEDPPAATHTPDGQTTPEGQTVPPVEVIQDQPAPPPPQTPQPAPQPQVSTPAPAPQVPVDDIVEAPEGVDDTEFGDLIKMSPVGGSEIPIEKVPNAVGTATNSDLQNIPTSTIQNVLQSQVPGVIITDLQGNDYRFDVQFRGFTSSPVNGVAQGLAVYQNGVRINESFGDVVNFDFLPSNAIEGITVLPANPVFGLNAIGGSLSIAMRDGFTFQGTEIEVLAGAYERKLGSVATGQSSGPWGIFVALEGIDEDGWRDFSPTEIKRMYADIGWKNQNAEFHVNFTGADNSVGVIAASPVELLDLDWNRTFTSPQVTQGELALISVNGSVKATSTLTLSGVAYYRRYKQDIVDGNVAEFEACDEDGEEDEDGEFLCLEEEGGDDDDDDDPRLTSGGEFVLVEDIVGDDEAEGLGSLDRITQDAESYGGTFQAVSKRRLFGLPNQFLIGASADHGEVDYTAASDPGLIGPRFVVTGSGFVLDGPGELAARDLSTTNDYYGVYFSNTLDLTPKLAVTVGGRYNYAEIELKDNTGNFEELNATSTYERFNPMAGATFKVTPGITLYGSYAEANRAPTAAELACSDPENPCLIESFLTDDPPLEQVISRTWEVGLRGHFKNLGTRNNIRWTLGFFHAVNQDDIISIAAPEAGRGFFQNAGDTRRLGIEAGITYKSERLHAYANYNWVEATFQDAFIVASPANPGATECPEEVQEGGDCLFVTPGDRIPGIAEHKFKAGLDYYITPRWSVGGDIVATSDQIFAFDESNVARPLDGYVRVDLRSKLKVSDKVEIFGYVENVFDERYGLFGNFFEADEANEAAEAAGLGEDFFSDPRTITPAKPVAAYVGIRMKLD